MHPVLSIKLWTAALLVFCRAGSPTQAWRRWRSNPAFGGPASLRAGSRHHESRRDHRSRPTVYSLFAALLLLLSVPAALRAGDTPPPPAPELIQRADKIVAALQLTDAAQAARVSDLVARQYAALRVVHQQRDNGLALADETPDKAQAEPARLRIKDTATARQAALHYAFIAALSAELTPAQVDGVKDGMTYGVLPNTFKVYQEMLPNLTAEQKRQILAWLTEAREHAMDASTSDEKHGWFGKYKGRINNYLAQAGIDMKQAEKDMFARKKGEKDQGPKTKD